MCAMSQDQLHKTQKITSTKTGGGRWNYPVRVVMDGSKEIAQESQTTESAAQKC